MCIVEKCCYILPLNLACVVLGVINFIISFCLTVTSIAYYFNEKDYLYSIKMLGKDQPHFVAALLGLDLKMGTVNIILSIMVLVGIFWMIFSLLLIAGVIKNEPSLVLCYYSFGILLTIMGYLSGLLFLLSKCWWLAIVTLIISSLNIHFIVVVYTVYDLMLKGKDFRFRRHQDQDEEPFAERFESFDGDLDA